MLSIFRSDDAIDNGSRQSPYLERRTEAVMDQSALPMDEAFLRRNLHFHEFHNQSRTCECGLSIMDYWQDANKSVCPTVCDGLCDLLPMLAD